MTITHKGSIIGSERRFSPSEIYGGLGALANTLFGGPRRTGVEVNPGTQEVTIHASYGSYTVREEYINSDTTCRRLKLCYIS